MVFLLEKAKVTKKLYAIEMFKFFQIMAVGNQDISEKCCHFQHNEYSELVA